MNQTQRTNAIERDANAAGSCVELIDVEAVARILGCSARTVYRLADSGKMPRPVKLGQLVRWPRAKVEGWIADGCPAVRGAIRRSRNEMHTKQCV